MRTVASRFTILALAVLVSLLTARAVQAQIERLTDDQVKRLLDDIDRGADRFIDAFDDRTKHAIIRGPQGDVDVKRFLDDFQEQITRARDRFRPEYSAGAEVFALLRRGSDIERATQSRIDRAGKAASEWEALAVNLRRLAENYGLGWPVDTYATGASRVNDRALRQTASDLENHAKALGKAIKKDKALDKGRREATARELETVAKTAKTLKDRIGDKRPATAEARELMGRASDVAYFCRQEPLGTESRRHWALVERDIDIISRAFGGRI